MNSETHFNQSGSSPPPNSQQSKHSQSAPSKLAPLNLDLIDERFRAQSVAALDAGDVVGFLFGSRYGNQYWVDIVLYNVKQLKARGLYEQALLQAYVGTRTNHADWVLDDLANLFRIADRDRLRAAGKRLALNLSTEIVEQRSAAEARTRGGQGEGRVGGGGRRGRGEAVGRARLLDELPVPELLKVLGLQPKKRAGAA